MSGDAQLSDIAQGENPIETSRKREEELARKRAEQEASAAAIKTKDANLQAGVRPSRPFLRSLGRV